MTSPRPAPLAIAILALVSVGLSSAQLARRIVAYNAADGREIYAFMEVYRPEFTYAGRDVTVEVVPGESEDRPASVVFRYGDDELNVPVLVPLRPYSAQLSGLHRFEDWFKIIRFAPLTGRSMEALQDAVEGGEVEDRLVLVQRSVRPGVNPETWGEVMRKDWIFEFNEFLPEGGFKRERFAYPTRRSVTDEPAPAGAGGLPELDSRTWQYQAADLLMPKGKAPRIMAGDSPLIAAGWTFPVAVVSVLIAAVALVAAFAPRRKPPLPA